MSHKTITLKSEADHHIVITSRHFELTEGMKEHILNKLSKIDHFTHHIIEIKVTLDIQKLDNRADLIIYYQNFKLAAHHTSHDMYFSIDKAIHKLQTRLKKFKDKLKKHHSKALSTVDMKVHILEAPQDIDDLNDQIEEENQKQMEHEYFIPKVIATETRSLKILTQSEAIMKMELSRDQFMIYRGEEDHKLKVIYRKQDQNYAVIEAE